MDKKILNFLEIYVLLYSNLRLMNIEFEDFSKIFFENIKILSNIFGTKVNIIIKDNKFLIDIINRKELLEEDIFLLNLLDYKNNKLNKILFELKESNFKNKKELINFFYLVKQTKYEQGYNFGKEVEYYKEKSFLIYNVLNSIFKTFRGEKDLLEASKYITNLINRYSLSTFYLFRVRNLFLYFYQTVVGREKFYYLLETNKNLIFNSKYLKLVFSDLIKTKKLNINNTIIDLFEGIILLHLLDGKGVKILLNLKGKIDNNIYYSHILIWIADYYLNTGEYKKGLDLLLDNYSNILNQNFKFYRKIFPLLILSNNKDKFLEIISGLLENNKYKINLYLKGKEIKNKLNIDYINFKDFHKINDHLNIPLDIEEGRFLYILNNSSNEIEMLSNLFKYIKKDHRDYFLKDDSISIILRKI